MDCSDGRGIVIVHLEMAIILQSLRGAQTPSFGWVPGLPISRPSVEAMRRFRNRGPVECGAYSSEVRLRVQPAKGGLILEILQCMPVNAAKYEAYLTGGYNLRFPA